MDGFQDLSMPVPRSVEVDGVPVGRGSRVVLRPRAGGDVMDRAVNGKVARVEQIHQDLDGRVHLAVTVEDDPGQDMGEKRRPGHRFFFSPDDVEPLAGAALPTTRVLVAGIGNVFMGDDGFGVEVARRLSGRPQPPGVDVTDFGIRGMDLVFALGEGYDAAVFVDAVPRDEPPGTLFVIEPDLAQTAGPVMLDAHGMDPVKVLALAGQMGPVPDRILVIGCVPQVAMTGDEEELVGDLSEPVRAALDEAVKLVESVLGELLAETETQGEVR
ncbi:MAG: hydrogenase maturation protease [Thermoleophilaceae bacterium]|jgi:hydrogenase maturation protease|nr:hydrogenase maturation protease [Thermoleophilaceae bacterium]